MDLNKFGELFHLGLTNYEVLLESNTKLGQRGTESLTPSNLQKLNAAADVFFKNTPKTLQDFSANGWCRLNYNDKYFKNTSEKKECKQLSNSKAIHKNELIEGILAYHEKHPHDIKVKQSIQILLHGDNKEGDIPWLIDDLNYNKGIDENIRTKIDDCKQSIDQLLSIHGINHQSDPARHERLTAVMAFYFVAAPVNTKESNNAFQLKYGKSFSKWYQSMIEQEQDPEEKALLAKFERYLKKTGGLGSLTWEEEVYEERSALEVFNCLNENNLEVNSCTKSHKVLYHVFQQMGLKAQFVLVKGPDHDQSVKEKSGGDTYTKGRIHICLSVHFGNEKNSRLFDLTHINTFQSRARYKDFYSLNLRQYASIDFMNQANSESITTQESIELLEKSLFFDSNNPYAYNSLSFRYFQLAQLADPGSTERQKHLEKSKKMARKSIQLDVDYAPAYNRLGITLMALANEAKLVEDTNTYEKLQTLALEQFNEANRLDPKFGSSQEKISLLYSQDN